MSPLARRPIPPPLPTLPRPGAVLSLLALGALLVASDDLTNCVEKIAGRATANAYPEKGEDLLPEIMAIANYFNNCEAPMVMVGLGIRMCSMDPAGPRPMLVGPPPGRLNPTGFYCSGEQDCVRNVTLYCDKPGSARPSLPFITD